MQNIKMLPTIAVVAMSILSFTNLFGYSIAAASVFIGVAAFFINKASERQPFADSGLDVKAIGRDLKDRRIWLWLALPTVMDVVSAGLSKLVQPEYVAYELARAGEFVSFDRILTLVIQLAVLALGEEIAWRAFYQKQLTKILPLTPVLLISSALFALGHVHEGNAAVVGYSVFFVFVNSILYGVIFHKTNNAWISAISHFVANLLSVFFLPFFV